MYGSAGLHIPFFDIPCTNYDALERFDRGSRMRGLSVACEDIVSVLGVFSKGKG